MNRTEFQHLADVRIKEAEALLAAGLWDGAYYLAGYAVECGLKACIAKLTKAEDFPPGKDEIAKIYSHRIEELAIAAKLKTDLDAVLAGTPAFKVNWVEVIRWKEDARYKTWPEPEARQLYEAITDPTNGVLPWFKARW